MIFDYAGTVFLAPRQNNKLTPYRSAAYVESKLRLGFTVSELGERKTFRKTGFLPTPRFKVLEDYTFSNKGLLPFQFGWIGFSKFSSKILMVAEPVNDNYNCIVLGSDKDYEEIGGIAMLSKNALELAPDDFKFNLRLKPTLDYLEYYDGCTH